MNTKLTSRTFSLLTTPTKNYQLKKWAMENESLWHILTNILGKNDSRCLDDVADRAAVRDALYSTILQTFDLTPARSTN